MRYLAYLLMALFLAAVESSLPLVLRLDDGRPMLVLLLVIHVALRLNTVEGALLSISAGFIQDVTSGFPSGLSAFACVALFVAMRMALSGLRADGRLFEALLAFSGVFFWHTVTTAAKMMVAPSTSSFLAAPWLVPVFWSALATALVSPLVMKLVRQVERIAGRSGGASRRV